MDRAAIGRMSCNPSIGGIAKSHIVCELDGLGGEIARKLSVLAVKSPPIADGNISWVTNS